jgi:hypothetical protein
MADTVNTQVLHNGRKKYSALFTNLSDGTGEAAVKKIDVSTLTGPSLAVVTYLSIEEIHWDIQGFTDVRLLFDATTDDLAYVMSPGQGFVSFKDQGGLVDPQSTGTTGDLMLTTTGAASGDTYSITVVCRVNE